jgi:hypothetical protein
LYATLVRGLPCRSSSLVGDGRGSVVLLSIEGGGDEEGGVGRIVEMGAGLRFRFGELYCVVSVLRVSIMAEGRGFNMEIGCETG